MAHTNTFNMEFQNGIVMAISAIGFASLSNRVFSFLFWLWTLFFRPAKNLHDYGSWAIITGCTDGIGKALAFEFASKGLNLLLVGRDPTKLKATTKEIKLSCGDSIQFKSVVIDFEKIRGEEVSRKIEESIDGLDVGILVNNAGVAYPYARYFHEVDLELMERVMKVNMEAATWMIRGVLPKMLMKKKGAILNIGSAITIAVPSYPLYTIYGSTKAYLAMLSKSIGMEYKNHGIDVQCQAPMAVATKMTKVGRFPFFIASPEMYAKACVRSIGYDRVCSPLWSHAMHCFILHALPDWIANWGIFQYFLGVRQRGLETEEDPSRVKNACGGSVTEGNTDDRDYFFYILPYKTLNQYFLPEL